MEAHNSQIPQYAYNSQIPQYAHHAHDLRIDNTGYGARDLQQYLQRPSASTIQTQQMKKTHEDNLTSKYQHNMQSLDQANKEMAKLTRQLLGLTDTVEERQGDILSSVSRLREVNKEHIELQASKDRLTPSTNTNPRSRSLSGNSLEIPA